MFEKILVDSLQEYGFPLVIFSVFMYNQNKAQESHLDKLDLIIQTLDKRLTVVETRLEERTS